MRLRAMVVVMGALALAVAGSSAASASAKFPDLPGMRAAERLVGGRTPSALSTGSGGTQTEKASAPVASSSDSDGSTTSGLPSTKSIREMPGAHVLPAFTAAARHPLALPLGLVLLAFFVCLGWTKLLYALNRV